MQGQCETESRFRLWVLSTRVSQSASKASVHWPKELLLVSLGRERNLINQQASKSNNRGVQINHRCQCSRSTWFLWNRRNQIATLPSHIGSHCSRSSHKARTTDQNWASFRAIEKWRGRKEAAQWLTLIGNESLSCSNGAGSGLWGCRYEGDGEGASCPSCMMEVFQQGAVVESLTRYGKMWTMSSTWWKLET